MVNFANKTLSHDNTYFTTHCHCNICSYFLFTTMGWGSGSPYMDYSSFDWGNNFYRMYEKSILFFYLNLGMTDEQLKKMQLESIERRLLGVKAAMKETFHPPIKKEKHKCKKRDMNPDIEIICRLRKLYFEGVERHNKIILERKRKKSPPKIDIQKIISANKIVEKPLHPKKWVADPPVHPDEKKEFVRPPAIYSNIPSPYGIADELHSKSLDFYL